MTVTINHILFDCDNTLVLSEHLAFEACCGLINEILAQHNVSVQFTPQELISEFVGMNFRGMVVALQKKYGFPIPEDELTRLVREEEDRVIAKLSAMVEPCVGVNEVLDKLYKEKQYGLAVVSSSAERRVRASLVKAGQDAYFPENHIFSAATSLPTPTSKPDPAVYTFACKVIGKQPEQCVAVEDSKSGTLSAVRAGIPVVGYVGSYEPERQEEMTKVLQEAGAKIVMRDWKEFEGILDRM
ncbi:HAD hydrolase, family IA [Spizellomyces punctatus DAOM BR117]|uniref:HAD hydrolase, family IA n=1 Tax=Spizellomyces punctatus (strain DAOM BR117) TaxID=645134 RepID=A0A0L0H9M3_SPIPD|nr:HAD hydrolase, family IA [Spizellomyces punctatus DAOM BR117]KNC97716.1 HAD hydrolase, family IA [Spizellomyces punctatus DAOM BR117]|eukprot:XP_016605756.1 HAD hydrolase, family IA [Spizellomyces punctatus DAOM BR117]